MKPYHFEAVILTTRGRREPHAEALRRSNPGLATHVWNGPETGMDGWRNCDRNVREAWRELRETIGAEWVLFLEWDVYVSRDLREVFPRESAHSGLVAAAVKSRVTDRRSFLPFREMDLLPEPLRRVAVGVCPSAVLMIGRDALEDVIRPEHDALFAESIISEIRLGSLLRALDFPVGAAAWLKDVGTTPKTPPPGARGVFHPVKKEVRFE